MWHTLDGLLVFLLVLISAIYAAYTLAPVKLKRSVLQALVRIFGVRVFAVFSPRLSGCGQCSADDVRKDLLKKLSADK